MKLALLSDVHSNLQALQACLADASSRGAAQYAFLGDQVGYGGDPGPVLDIIMDLAQRGAWVLRGNHDDAALNPTLTGNRADLAGAAATFAALSAAQREFLAGLPLMVRHEFMCLVHASVREPARWHYVQDSRRAAESLHAAEESGATHIFGGHVHEQRLFFHGAVGKVMAFEPIAGVAVPLWKHRRWLATVGSVGQPRDGRPEAMYALFDTESMQMTFLRVPYDHQAAGQAILLAGLPPENASRLAQGL